MESRAKATAKRIHLESHRVIQRSRDLSRAIRKWFTLSLSTQISGRWYLVPLTTLSWCGTSNQQCALTDSLATLIMFTMLRWLHREISLPLALETSQSDSGTTQLRATPRWSRLIKVLWGLCVSHKMDSSSFQAHMTCNSRLLMSVIENQCSPFRRIKTGSDLASSLQILGWLLQDLTIRPSNFGTSRLVSLSTPSRIMSKESTQSNSTQMVPASRVALKIAASKSGTSDHRG